MQVYLIILLVGVLFINDCFGACGSGPLLRKTVYGRPVYYCKYKGFIIRFNEKKKKLPEPLCEECSCSNSGLSCCGYGAALFGVMRVAGNSKCFPIKDGCDLKWVYRDNENKECSKKDRYLK